MTDSLDGGKSLRGPSGHVRFPQEHRRASLHLHAIGFTPSGIADELNAQFGTSYSRRSVLLELSSPASGSLRDAARHVRPEADTATASAGRRRLETPPLDDGAPMSAIGSVEAERRALRRVDRLPLAVPGIRQDRCADTRGGNTQAQALVALMQRGPVATGNDAWSSHPAFSGGRGVPLAKVCGCRWPVAGDGAATLFCDAPQADGSSYCPGHKALAGNGFSFKGVA